VWSSSAKTETADEFCGGRERGGEVSRCRRRKRQSGGLSEGVDAGAVRPPGSGDSPDGGGEHVVEKSEARSGTGRQGMHPLRQIHPTLYPSDADRGSGRARAETGLALRAF